MTSDSHRPDGAHEEELVPEDDTVIGVAFRRSLLVLGGLGALAALIFFLRPQEQPEETILEKDVGQIEDLVVDEAVLPEVRFTDITEQAGIDFVHENGARGEKLLPETMGGGGAFFDYDLDGDPDLLLVNSMAWPHDDPPATERGHVLLANDGSGRFTDVSAETGLELRSYGMGVAIGDYDGDGRPDVFLTGIGGSHLLRNTEDGFVDVTSAAGVGGDPDDWSTSAGFFDADGDGDLDLFVCHYVRWSREIDEQLAFTLNGADRAYGPPTNYEGAFSRLYLNRGDGSFADVSAEAGIQVRNPATNAPMGKALGVSFADFDQDGRMDIVVANDTVQNHLFHNLGEGRFEEIGATVGLGFGGNGEATGAMGIDVGDYRGEGDLAVCIGNFANEMSSLYVAPNGELFFTDDAIGEGIGSPSRQRLSFGMFFFDYDLDGRLDLLQVNGHLEESINEVQPSQHYLQPAQLFWNAGPDQRVCYMEVPPETAGDLATKIAGRGSAYADIDGDGDLDVLLAQVGARPLLLRNDQELGRHWLRVRLVGRSPNTDASGAWVHVRNGDQLLRRQVSATRSYLSQSELTLTFGLGPDPDVKAIEVHWPDGTRQEVPLPDSLDRTLTIRHE